MFLLLFFFFFFFNDTATTEIYTLSLHDALPILTVAQLKQLWSPGSTISKWSELNPARSEEHTSELQSPCNLVCRLLLEKKKKKKQRTYLMFDGVAQYTPHVATHYRKGHDHACHS